MSADASIDEQQPVLPYDIIQYALPRFLSYATQWALGQTCRRLACVWTSWVHALPRRVHRNCDDERVRRFGSLAKLRLVSPVSESCPSDVEWSSFWPEEIASPIAYQTYRITNAGLAQLTSLTFLDLSENTNLPRVVKHLWDEPKMVSLRRLLTTDCAPINDYSLSCLTNLRTLIVGHNTVISDHGISGLASLQVLDLTRNETVTDRGVACLTSLTRLDISCNSFITDRGISSLTALTWLDVGYSSSITDQGISSLTALTWLGVRFNSFITDQGISSLTALKTLSFAGNNAITCACVAGLHQPHALREYTRRDGRSVLLPDPRPRAGFPE